MREVAGPAATLPVAQMAPSAALRALTLAALLLLTLVAFGGVVRNGWFDVDDHAYVLDNPHVNRGLTAAGAGWVLTHSEVANWSPVTMLSHMLDVQLFGLDAGRHHAVSLAWHALNAILLLLVLHGYTGAWWRSALVAGLFALHPLRVESVAWVSDRKDLLGACFFLLTLDAWRRWVLRPSVARYALVCAWLWLGLLAKPVLVTTPFVLLLLDAWPLGRLLPGAGTRGRIGDAWPRVAEKWPLWLTIAGFTLLTIRTQAAAGALTIVPGLTWPLRASNAVRSVLIYARDTAWPRDLSPFVPHDLKPHLVAAVAAVLAIGLVTALVLRLSRRPWLAFGWFWYVGTLVPVLNFVQVGPHARADRFTYVPAIGLAVMLAWEVAERVGRARVARVAATTGALAVMAVLAIATARQVARWRNTRTVYEWILQVNPGNTSIRWRLADLCLHEGQPAPALEGYEQVARALPSRIEVHTDIAAALAALGRDREAREHLQRVVAGRPSADAWGNLGRMDARLGETGRAAVELDSALSRAPNDAPTHVDLALVLANAGDLRAAAGHLARAVELAPGRPEYRRAYAETLKQLGRYTEALAQYEAVLAARPDDVNALLNAAWMRATLPDARARDGAEAVRMAEHARAVAGGPVAVLEAACAAAYAEAGRWGDAIAAADRAVERARAGGSAAEADEYARQRAAYRAGRPWRGLPR